MSNTNQFFNLYGGFAHMEFSISSIIVQLKQPNVELKNDPLLSWCEKFQNALV